MLRSKVKGHRGQQTKKFDILFGSRPLGARTSRAAFFWKPSSGTLLRRWENQGMLCLILYFSSPLTSFFHYFFFSYLSTSLLAFSFDNRPALRFQAGSRNRSEVSRV